MMVAANCMPESVQGEAVRVGRAAHLVLGNEAIPAALASFCHEGVHVHFALREAVMMTAAAIATGMMAL